MSFLRKNIRLSSENYTGKRGFFITICCADRQKFFARASLCRWFTKLLRQDAASHQFAVHAYCLMPDHVHLLVEGLAPCSDLLGFVKALKTKSSEAWRQKTSLILWQKKFYDYILRQKDSHDDVAWYIWTNPVRARMCLRPEDFPFAGSFTGVGPKAAGRFSEWLPTWRTPKDAPESLGPLQEP